MFRTNRLNWLLLLVVGSVCGATCGHAHAAVLYDENFTGNALDILHGTAPDVDNNGGGNLWVGHTGFKADGSMTVPSGGSGVWLPFSPTSGNVYTLSATLSGIAGDGNWIGFGFSEQVPINPQGTGNGNRFISDPTNGKAWMLARGSNSANPNQLWLGDASSGTPASGSATAAWQGGPTDGGDVNLRIELDTTAGAGNYTATFSAKRPTDIDYTIVSGGPVDLNDETIGAVGFAGSNAAISATITKFMLETTGSIIVPGDVTGDGNVDELDFFEIRDHLFQNGNRSQGDLTNDGFVDFLDFRVWKDAHEAAFGAGSTANFTIPEPGSLSLALGMALAACGALTRRRTADSRVVH